MVNILVLATTNRGKVKEFQAMLEGVEVEIKCLSDFGPLPEAVEDGSTFDENAYKKSSHYARILGLPTIADDSGLLVEALNGAPGVFSARYAGENSSDQENVEKLLREMDKFSNRRATFQCTISIAVPSGPALTYEGQCHGSILREKRGQSGFGYDPVFYHEEMKKTFAEMSMEEKNMVSHRGKALREIREERDKILRWLEIRLAEEKPEKPDHDAFMENDWSS